MIVGYLIGYCLWPVTGLAAGDSQLLDWLLVIASYGLAASVSRLLDQLMSIAGC